jgi:ankyrin repeat protein
MSSKWETTEIHLAAYNCDLELLHERIAAGDDIHLKDSSGYTPLLWCCFRAVVGENQHEIAKTLLDAGANPNDVTSPNNESALEWAIQAGNPRVVEILLHYGADVNLVGLVTPLIAAARKGDAEMIQLLLRRGADASIKVCGYSADYYAKTYSCENYEELKKLLDQKIEN